MEEHYNFEDALLVGLMMITLLKHADRIKIACLAQLVNVLAPIMTDAKGGVYKQTIYYPFLHASKYGRGVVLQTLCDTPSHETRGHGLIKDIVSVAVYQEEKEELTVFAVNRNLEEQHVLEVDVRSFEGYEVLEKIEMVSEDLKAENTLTQESVKPSVSREIQLSDGKVETVLKKASWNVIRMGKVKR